MRQFALSTSDNPCNPIKNFNGWYEFDEEMGYHTCQYLARIVSKGEGLSEELNNKYIEEAIDDIVKRNLIGLETEYKVNYIKVTDQQKV